ncbi:MAG: hypothetical protein LBE35_09990 [Clostridiales bacterium]|jgi:hypothetical protein|nr:hypothetical protein [Clostridiales bacterium]
MRKLRVAIIEEALSEPEIVDMEIYQIRWSGEFDTDGTWRNHSHELMWESGRNRDWEEDIAFLAQTFLHNHPLLIDDYVLNRTFRDLEATPLSVERPGVIPEFLLFDLHLESFFNPQLRNEFIGRIDALIS